MPGRRIKDRRVQKTQRLLHDALVSLIHEKDYDAIVVKEILDRANVGRSTFYTHFRDKDDLLASGIHDMLGSVRSSELPSSAKRYERMIWFSLPIFQHIEQLRRTGHARIGTRGRGIIHAHLQRVLSELMEADATDPLQHARKAVGPIPQELLIQFVASTFILVLNWWVERSSLPANDVNDVYRALVLPTLAASWE